VARLLGFARVTANSVDAVADRDAAAEFLAAAAICAVHLSRLAEELVLWATEEFGFIELPDGFATGSSMMPQKKNPDVAELVRGLTPARSVARRRVLGGTAPREVARQLARATREEAR